ncbi:MAG: chitobiase/beta-hexosaminidase C-terminal domain-containing protein [Saprospiraceae bacterium]
MLSRIASNIGFGGLFLLGFLLLFEGSIEIPFWLQPIGRMHPLLLHLPIGILSLLILLPLLKKEIPELAYQQTRGFVIDLGLILSVLTTIMGLFLAQEDGYATDNVSTHKWLAVAFCGSIYALHLLQQHWPQKVVLSNATLGLSFLLMIGTGHVGGEITHGEDFVLSPIRANEPAPLDESSLFAAVIKPVLKDKCLNCHNENKAKGDLVMTTSVGLLKGGKSGVLWDLNQPDSSLILQRLHLPISLKKHMPPKGKPQLNQQEIDLLTAWIKEGADMEKKMDAFPTESQFQQLAQPFLAKEMIAATEEPRHTFPPASEATLEKLNGPLRSVYAESLNSPALSAKISVRKYYQPRLLEELLAVKDQLIYLNLTDLPIKDEEIGTISRFVRLEKLILNGTDIKGNTLDQLKSCEKLTSLALSSTAVGPQLQSALDQLSSLKELFVWNTQIDSLVIKEWTERYPQITFYQGFVPDSIEVLKLNPPMLKNEKLLLAKGEKVVIQHNLPGTVIRYTTDGSEPDSLKSLVYTEPIPISGITTIQTKAFRTGWLGSDMASFTIFQEGVKPDSVTLNQPSDGKYRGVGPNTLIDGEKGLASNFQSPLWLGFKKNPLEAVFQFEQAIPISRIVLSYAVNMGSYIMPPEKVEIWGGNEEGSMQKITELRPEQPQAYGPTQVQAFSLDFAPSTYRLFKVIAHPIPKLPPWHNGKGDKAWVFSDEVLFFGQ